MLFFELGSSSVVLEWKIVGIRWDMISGLSDYMLVCCGLVVPWEIPRSLGAHDGLREQIAPEAGSVATTLACCAGMREVWWLTTRWADSIK